MIIDREKGYTIGNGELIVNKRKIHIGAGVWLAIIGSIAVVVLIIAIGIGVSSPEYKVKDYINSVYNRDPDGIMKYLSNDDSAKFENFFNKIQSQELQALQQRSDKVSEYTVNNVNISDDKNSAVVNVSIQYTDLQNVLNVTTVEYVIDKVKSGELQYNNIESKNESTIQDILSNVDLQKSTTKQLDFQIEMFKEDGNWKVQTDSFEDLGNAVTYGLYDSIENPNPQWIEQIKAEVSSLDDRQDEILSQEIIDVDINDLLNWYENNNQDYNNLNNKHVRLQAYVKNTGQSQATINYVTYDDVPYISVDGQAMDSFFGSRLTFYNTTDKQQIESLEDGQRVIVQGIARTDGLTFEMDHCTLENTGSSEFNESDFIQADPRELIRNPNEWKGRLVWFEGTVQQVVNSEGLFSTSRYVVRIDNYPILFKSVDGVGFAPGDYVKVYGKFDGILDVETLLGLDMEAADIKAIRIYR